MLGLLSYSFDGCSTIWMFPYAALAVLLLCRFPSRVFGAVQLLVFLVVFCVQRFVTFALCPSTSVRHFVLVAIGKYNTRRREECTNY